MENQLVKYVHYFSNLHANKQRGKSAPHKAIMLLSVIKLIASKRIVTNKIVFTEELQHCFLSTWKQHIGESAVFKPAVGTPFWHLNSEPFWRLVPFVGGDDTIATLQKGNPYSIKAICENIRYAQIDQELFLLLQNEDDRSILQQTLINSLDF